MTGLEVCSHSGYFKFIAFLLRQNHIYFLLPQGNMTVARTAVGATTLHGLIYAVGGECALAESQEETMYLRCTEVYDPIMKEWHSCADIGVARSFISLCSLGGYLYALGKKYLLQRNFSTFQPIYL